MSKEIKVGDFVRCINDGQINNNVGKKPPLRFGLVYVVNGINTCSCGGVSYDVGLSSDILRGTQCSCGKIILPANIHFCNSKRFAKIDESEKSEENSEIIDNSELVKELLTKQMYES